MKTTLLLLLTAALWLGCERRPREVPLPGTSAVPPGASSLTNAITLVPTNPEATVINRPVDNPPLTNREPTNPPAPPP